MLIKQLQAREILDSRGNPTIEVEVKVNQQVFTASVPAGASIGHYEAYELRDNDFRFNGKGVLKAVNNVNKIIASSLVGQSILKQTQLDNFLIQLDGTKNKKKLGANAILGVSMVISRALAATKKIELFEYLNQLFREQIKKPFYQSDVSSEKLIIPVAISSKTLPLLYFNILNGGVHAGNQLKIQEFMIVPKSKTISQSLLVGVKLYQVLKKILLNKYGFGAINVGDEGGFSPPLSQTKQALDLILEAITQVDYQNQVKIALDCAASEFYQQGKYHLDGDKLSLVQLLDFYLGIKQHYPLISIEDPFFEDSWSDWADITNQIGSEITIIGDDLLVTNPIRMEMAQKQKSCNGLLLKINQIGTISEAIAAAILAKQWGWKVIVSHRSGETTDNFIADLAVGILADCVKFGAPVRGERVVKYNRLLKIEQILTQ